MGGWFMQFIDTENSSNLSVLNELGKEIPSFIPTISLDKIKSQKQPE